MSPLVLTSFSREQCPLGGFQKNWIPLNHPNFTGIFPSNPSIFGGTPHDYGAPHFGVLPRSPSTDAEAERRMGVEPIEAKCWGVQLGFPSMGLPQARWMVYFMENLTYKWMMTGGYPYF